MARAAALGTARRRGRVHEELADKLSLLRKDLNPVRAPLTDIDETVHRDMDAMQRGGKLLLIGRRAHFPVVRGRGVIADLAERLAVAAPAALECRVVHVVHEDTF